MKELYISPEAKLLGFAPVERLASDFDDLIGETDTVYGNVSGVIINETLDIDIDLKR